jgi:hypothetical protein
LSGPPIYRAVRKPTPAEIEHAYRTEAGMGVKFP